MTGPEGPARTEPARPPVEVGDGDGCPTDTAALVCSAREQACTRISCEHDEPMVGTVSAQARGWVLLEHPGPWGEEPAGRNGLVPERVRGTASRHGLRVQLIRRHGRHDPDEGYACYLGHAGYTGGWLEHRRVGSLGEVLDADLPAVAEGRRPAFGTLVDGLVVLVCTHGRVDACCAELGRPVAAALQEAGVEATQVWETSHVGGDRFAANVVVLPRGLHYGRLSPVAAGTAVRRAASGRVLLEGLRGRPGRRLAVQAAELHVRRLEGLDRLDALRVVGHVNASTDEVAVCLASSAHVYRVRVRRESHPQRVTSCGADSLHAPIHWRPFSLVREPRRPSPPAGPDLPNELEGVCGLGDAGST